MPLPHTVNTSPNLLCHTKNNNMENNATLGQQQLAGAAMGAQQVQHAQPPAGLTGGALMGVPPTQAPSLAAAAADHLSPPTGASGMSYTQQPLPTPPPAGLGSASIDMASVLAKIQALEREKADLSSRLDMTQGRLSKLQEGKRAEMEQLMNSTISKWLEQLPTKDAASKDNLRSGLEKLVKDGNESGVWEVVACASSNWQNNVNQIEALTQEINSYREKEKQLQGGLFQAESSRFFPGSSSYSAGQEGYLSGTKRPAPDSDMDRTGYNAGHRASEFGGSSTSAGDMWSELESMFIREGGIKGADYSQNMPPLVPAAISNMFGGGGRP